VNELGERLEMDEVKVRKVLKIAKEPISMETPIGDDDFNTFASRSVKFSNTSRVASFKPSEVAASIGEVM
jgi:DNA-directed RNA polymerase sigma subunit (sigma70/sigma32)